MVRDTPSSQDASTHQIWNPYLKEYRRYAPDTKRDGQTHGRTDGQTVRLLYDVKLNTKQHHLNGDTVQDAVLLQNRKFRQIRSNLVSACSSRPT